MEREGGEVSVGGGGAGTTNVLKVSFQHGGGGGASPLDPHNPPPSTLSQLKSTVFRIFLCSTHVR